MNCIKMLLRCLPVLSAVTSLIAARAAANPTVLHAFDLAKLRAAAPFADAKTSVALTPDARFTGGPALQWETESTGEALRLTGDLPWAEAKFLALDIYYDSDHAGMLQLRFYARGEKAPRLTTAVSLFPRLRTRVAFPLEMLDAQRVFLPRTPARLKGVLWGRRLNPDEVSHVALALEDTGDRQRLYLGNITLLSAEPQYPVPDEKVVDELGQWTARDWSGKTKAEAALKRQLEEARVAALKASFPEGWSRYGGTQARRFKTTGFFRTEHDGRRWWLVDPEGCGFFSAGLDCVRSGEDSAILPGMEQLCRWLPETNGPFASAVSRRRDTRSVDFGKANLIRAFGGSWRKAWRELVLGRLMAWRFNTVANWSELDLLRPLRFPYVIQLGRYPTTPRQLFRDFPDVFAPEFRESARRYAQGLEGVKADPYLLGYFLCNEPVWGFGQHNLAAEMLEANPGTATRRELAAWLGKRYAGEVAAWAKAWGREFKSFDEMMTGTFHRIGDASPKAHDDLWAFSREMVRTYVRIPCEAVKQVDPNHLNLGMRYAWIASDLFYDAGESFDVFSINCYQMEAAFDSINTITKRTGKPVIIGEFHFGALDRGLPATGLRGVASQADRGVAYRRYLESGAANPNLVGVHYFILNDQAVLGRFDGENYQIGFQDVCHTPYPELVEQAQAAHEAMYDVMTGARAPFAQQAREVPKIK
jgi:hypothetical protein